MLPPNSLPRVDIVAGHWPIGASDPPKRPDYAHHENPRVDSTSLHARAHRRLDRLLGAEHSESCALVRGAWRAGCRTPPRDRLLERAQRDQAGHDHDVPTPHCSFRPEAHHREGGLRALRQGHERLHARDHRDGVAEEDGEHQGHVVLARHRPLRRRRRCRDLRRRIGLARTIQASRVDHLRRCVCGRGGGASSRSSGTTWCRRSRRRTPSSRRKRCGFCAACP